MLSANGVFPLARHLSNKPKQTKLSSELGSDLSLKTCMNLFFPPIYQFLLEIPMNIKNMVWCP